MIVQMKRLTLVAHKTDERAIVDALQPLGAVEVQKDESASFCADQLAAAETRVQKLGDALNVLKPYGEKQGLLAPQPERTLAQISRPASISASVKERSARRSSPAQQRMQSPSPRF